MQVMTRIIKFDSEARAEFDDAVDWYERRSAGRGTMFADAVLLILDRIRQQPDFYPVVKKDVRQAIVAKNPSCVYYREDDQTILVISIFHASRNPEIWHRRGS